MSGDELDGEVSASLEVMPNGVKAAAKSRTLNAIDWVGGAWLVNWYKQRSSKATEAAVIAELRVRMIQAAGDATVDKIRSSPEVAASIISAATGIDVDRASNRIQSMNYALEDLSSNQPTEDQQNDGPEEIPRDTLNRWGRYAEDADSEALRERWGKVLAAEIRNPGTISNKTLRIVDEIDFVAAAVFDAFCRHALAGFVPHNTAGVLSFNSHILLVEAGLIVDPGLTGHIRTSSIVSLDNGFKVRFLDLGRYAFAWPENVSVTAGKSDDGPIFVSGSTGPSMPIYLLTDAGNALLKITKVDEEANFKALAIAAAKTMPPGKLILYRLSGSKWEPMTIPEIAPPDIHQA